MKYCHGLSTIGGISMEDGRTVLLFYKEFTGPNHSYEEAMKDPVKVIEESQFALLLPSSAKRGDFESKVNQVQMELDETYLAQTILSLENEFIILC